MNQRILFITERYPPDLGGVATSAGRISRAIASLGVQVDVVAWTRSLQAGQVEQYHGNPSLTRIGRYREWDTTMPHTMNLCDWLFSRHTYDATWGHYLSPAGFFATWIAKLKGIASTVSIRGNDLDRDMFPPGDFARLHWTLQNATSLTTVTRELAAKVSALTGRTGIIYLPNAVDSEVFASVPKSPNLREHLGIQQNEAVLGFAGELREKKGLRFLLEALVKVRQNRPACLLIIGEVRPSEMPQLIPFIGTATPEQHRIIITGQLTTPQEVNQHLQLCDIYLQPSLWDGMPNALLEAMSAGCLCIGSDAGGIPEIIQHSENGILIPRWELQNLADAVNHWLDADQSTKAAIRTAARTTTIENFNSIREREALQQIRAGWASTPAPGLQARPIPISR